MTNIGTCLAVHAHQSGERSGVKRRKTHVISGSGMKNISPLKFLPIGLQNCLFEGMKQYKIPLRLDIFIFHKHNRSLQSGWSLDQPMKAMYFSLDTCCRNNMYLARILYSERSSPVRKKSRPAIHVCYVMYLSGRLEINNVD